MPDSDTHYQQARHRAGRRKSAWNFLLIPLTLAGWATAYIGLYWFVKLFQQLTVPEGAWLFRQANGGEVLMVLPLFFGSVPPGLMLANMMAWCIPPARRAFEREAKAHPGTSFHDAMAAMFKASVFFLLVCLPVSLVGARIGLSHVSDEGVGIGWTVHPWSEVHSVSLWCCGTDGERKQSSWMGYELSMTDDSAINLLSDFPERNGPRSAELRQRRIEGLERMQPYLEAQDGIHYRWQWTTTANKRLRRRYKGEPWVDALADLFEENEARSKDPR